jgi:hypothetical protein
MELCLQSPTRLDVVMLNYALNLFIQIIGREGGRFVQFCPIKGDRPGVQKHALT